MCERIPEYIDIARQRLRDYERGTLKLRPLGRPVCQPWGSGGQAVHAGCTTFQILRTPQALQLLPDAATPFSWCRFEIPMEYQFEGGSPFQISGVHNDIGRSPSR